MLSLVRQNGFYGIVLVAFVVLVVLDSFVFQMPKARVGDMVEHISALNAWLDQPFSPENPGVFSDASSPRYIPIYFPFVLLGSLLGWGGWFTFNVIALSGAFLFIYAAHTFFRSLSDFRHAPLLGWVIFMGVWAKPWNYSSVYAFSTLYKITAYPSILAFSLSLICLAVLRQVLERETVSKRELISLLLLTAIVMSSHILTGSFLLGAAALFILSMNSPARLKIKLLFAGGLGVLMSCFWPYYSVWEVVTNGYVTSGASWISDLTYRPHRSGTLIDNHSFYEFRRYYPVIFGLMAALYLASQRQWMPLMGILGFGAIFILNLFLPIPLGHRFLIYTIFFGHLAIFFTVVQSLYHRPELTRLWPIVFGLASVFFVIVNAMRIIPQLGPGNVKILERNLQIQSLTDDKSVIAGHPETMWLMTAYDRKALWLKHPNPLVKDRYGRALANTILLAPQASVRTRQMAQSCFGVTHLILFEGWPRNPDEETLALLHRLDEDGVVKHKVDKRHWLYKLNTPNTDISCNANAFDEMRAEINDIYYSE